MHVERVPANWSVRDVFWRFIGNTGSPPAYYSEEDLINAALTLKQPGTREVGTGVGANPTAMVQLAPVNGSADTFMRSDAAPALDQTIAPTWKSRHVFEAGASVFAGLYGQYIETDDDPYDAVRWDGNLSVPTKNAIRDVIEALVLSGAVIPGNPTALAGLTPVNGVALTFMRSDAAPAIDQAIAPTWTGMHTFAAGAIVPEDPYDAVNWNGNLMVPTKKAIRDKLESLVFVGGAAPGQMIGLTTVVGNSTAFMRSDAAPALDQSIEPTWTALHTFSAGLVTLDEAYDPVLWDDNLTVPTKNAIRDIAEALLALMINPPADGFSWGRKGNVWSPILARDIGERVPMKPGVVHGIRDERWVPIESGGGIMDVPREPVGEVYLRSFNRWMPAQQGGGPQPRKVNVSGDTMTGPLILSGNATDPMMAVPLQQLSALSVYVDLKDAAERAYVVTTRVEEAPSDGNQYVRQFRQWERLPASATPVTGSDPVRKIGLAVIPGTALTFMRSDAAPQLDQGIVPTWTGFHTFNQGVSVRFGLFGDVIETTDHPYDSVSWEGNRTVPTKNAIRDKIESLAGAAGADPSALIGLTALPGVATSFMRSDAAPAIDQAIAPTWTAMHNFSAHAQTADEAYDAAAWDLNFTVPTKHSLRAKIESLQVHDEVAIGTLDPKPFVPSVELWVDPAAGADKSVLKAWVQGRWVEITSGAGVVEEVYVGTTEPTDPATELWFDDAGVPAVPLNEVTIGTVEPVDDTELWYNPDAVPPVGIDYLPLAGGTLIGPLFLPAASPAAPEQAAHKAYVDQIVAASSLYQSIWNVAANTPDLTPSVANPLHSYSWVASTVDPMVAEIAPAGLPGIGGMLIGMNDTIVWNATLGIYEHLKSASASGAYLPLAGGTLSGPITMGEGAGLRWGSTSAGSDPTTLDEGICLYGWGSNSKYGFSVTGGTLNYVVEAAASKHSFLVGAAEVFRVNSGGATLIGDSPGINFNTVNSSAIFFNNSAGAVRFRIAVEDQHFYINAGGAGNCIDITRDGNVNLPISNLSVNGRITINANQHFTVTNDGFGLGMAGGSAVYKKAGSGGFLRESTGNTRWAIENNSGVFQGYISKQSTRDVGTVEELITNAITPLLARIATLETALNARK